MNIAFEKRVEEIEKARNDALAEVTDKYGKALTNIESQLMRAGDLDGAVAVRNRRAALLGLPVITTTPPLSTWATVKTHTTYSYLKDNSSKSDGEYDYSDGNCTKLLDGITKSGATVDSVGWFNREPSPILIRLPAPSKPSALRLHLLDYAKGQIGLPTAVRVYEVSSSHGAKGKKLAEIKGDSIKEGWGDIPFKMPFPRDSFIIELDRSDRTWVIMDELEFAF
jgi:hypothetical protein